MGTTTPRAQRRADALSKARIVTAAIGILDAQGEEALTFRALAAQLSTGAGAIYWHVANKDELLAAATDAVVERVMAEVAEGESPQASIRALALGVFDAIDAHPWVGAQLSSLPGQVAAATVFEGLGGPLDAFGVPARAQFDCAMVLANYILGVAGQNAAHARAQPAGTDRASALGEFAARWLQLDPARYPFVHRVAHDLPAHDDRAQFLAGVDMILAGIAAVG